MAVREILTYPNPLLKQVSAQVDLSDEIVQSLIDDLVETLHSFEFCVGIAAPQIGALQRIVVVDASRNRKPVANQGLLVLVNPVIQTQEGEIVMREGCLSLPDFTANVKRAKSIALTATARNGTALEIETTDFEARVILHEFDHLDGKLFLDRVSSLKTDVFRRKRY
jgi:peptide deformylase